MLCLAGLAAAATTALLSAGAAQEPGYWMLDRTEFWTRAGSLGWTGQNGVQVTVRQHDNAKLTIHEAEPRGLYTQTYLIAFHVPDRLIPGETAPFSIEQTCTQVNRSPSMPVPVAMGVTNLTASFNPDGYLQVPHAECAVGRTIKAPAPQWKIPRGSPGATATIAAAANPTNYSPLEQRFHFKWVTEPVPAAAQKPLPKGVTAECRDMFTQAVGHSAGGNRRLAIQFYTGLLKQCPTVCAAMNNLGSEHAALGERGAAQVWFDMARQCDPQNEIFRRNAGR